MTCSRINTINILFKPQKKFAPIYIVYSIQTTRLKFRLWVGSCGYLKFTKQLFPWNAYLLTYRNKPSFKIIDQGYSLARIISSSTGLHTTTIRLNSFTAVTEFSPFLYPWTLAHSLPHCWSMNICWMDDRIIRVAPEWIW